MSQWSPIVIIIIILFFSRNMIGVSEIAFSSYDPYTVIILNGDDSKGNNHLHEDTNTYCSLN